MHPHAYNFFDAVPFLRHPIAPGLFDLMFVQYVPSGHTLSPQTLLFRLSSIFCRYSLDGPQTPTQFGPGAPQSERQYSSQAKSTSFQRLQSEARRQRPKRSSDCCCIRSCEDCGGGAGWRGRCWTCGRCCWADVALPQAVWQYGNPVCRPDRRDGCCLLTFWVPSVTLLARRA